MLTAIDTTVGNAPTVADGDATTVGAESHMTVTDVQRLRATLTIDAEASAVVRGAWDPQGEDCGVWAS